MAALYNSKWSTENADIYRIGAAGTLQSLDLLKLCRTAEKEYFKRTSIKRKFDNSAQSVDIKSIGNNGTLHALCAMQVIKEDDTYSFALNAKLSPSGKGVAAKIGAFRRCKDDESEGDCAAHGRTGIAGDGGATRRQTGPRLDLDQIPGTAATLGCPNVSPSARGPPSVSAQKAIGKCPQRAAGAGAAGPAATDASPASPRMWRSRAPNCSPGSGATPASAS